MSKAKNDVKSERNYWYYGIVGYFRFIAISKTRTEDWKWNKLNNTEENRWWMKVGHRKWLDNEPCVENVLLSIMWMGVNAFNTVWAWRRLPRKFRSGYWSANGSSRIGTLYSECLTPNEKRTPRLSDKYIHLLIMTVLTLWVVWLLSGDRFQTMQTHTRTENKTLVTIMHLSDNVEP